MDTCRGMPDNIVVCAFKKCSIFNVFDGSQDELHWDESDKENSFSE